MSRKDYRAIADAIRSVDGSYLLRLTIADRIADVMASDNPRFKRDVFLSACGLDGDK